MRRRRHQQRHRHQDLIKIKDIAPLSNFDILQLVVKLRIPHFRGVFMRDTLMREKKRMAAKECWILNHGTTYTDGTHWTALAKNNNTAFYFDSFGKLPPPLEVINYLNKNIQLYYNAKKYQNYGTAICGHLCLRFLLDFWRQHQSKRGKNE